MSSEKNPSEATKVMNEILQDSRLVGFSYSTGVIIDFERDWDRRIFYKNISSSQLEIYSFASSFLEKDKNKEIADLKNNLDRERHGDAKLCFGLVNIVDEIIKSVSVNKDSSILLHFSNTAILAARGYVTDDRGEIGRTDFDDPSWVLSVNIVDRKVNQPIPQVICSNDGQIVISEMLLNQS